MDKPNSPKEPAKPTPPPSQPGPPPKRPPGSVAPTQKPPPLYRPIDWITFGATTLLVFVGYYLTLAPDLTLEDAGELAVGSFYAGVPHPPGYPVWTLYTWLFTHIPISNIAWRVGLSSAVAGAFACGMLALMVSRGSSLMLEDLAEMRGMEARWQNTLCIISGLVAGTLLGFNGFVWSQAVIVEVYTLSMLSFMAVLCCLFRWIYAPEQRRYLYWAFFWFGICFTNHQTLIVAAMGLEVLVIVSRPRIGWELLIGNSLVYLLGLAAKSAGVLTSFDSNPPLFVIYNAVGVGSIFGVAWLSVRLRIGFSTWESLFRDLLLLAGLGYVLFLFADQADAVSMDKRSFGFIVVHVIGLLAIAVCGQMTYQSMRAAARAPSKVTRILLYISAAYIGILVLASFRSVGLFHDQFGMFSMLHLAGLLVLVATIGLLVRQSSLASEIKVVTISSAVWLLGASFYFYMPLASMTNPPLNWGYPRTVEGFVHALTRGQYEQTNPTSSLGRFIDQIWYVYMEGAIDEFGRVNLLIGMIPFLFYRQFQKRERAWLVGLSAVFLCLAALLLILLNPNTDLQSRTQARVFFTSSHIIVAIAIGYGITLIGGLLATQYTRYRSTILWASAAAAGLELYSLFDTFSKTQFPLSREAALLGLGIALVFTFVILLCRHRVFLPVLLAAFALMPLRSVLSNWADNEQRGHLFGYWFGHDMFTPPFGIYPEMPKKTILFGGTDPGRFNPTYMIFCESFLPAKYKPNDRKFDRRDVYLITQNALADKTYLDYIRAHYNRSAESDPYFFSELVRSERERSQGRTNLISRTLLPLDQYFTDLGRRIENRRRTEGVYPPIEINTPSNEDSQVAFHDYLNDAARRLQHDRQLPNEPKQLKPGEGVNFTDDGRVQVSGQVAVMAINALLARVIFDKNPTNEFYIEESFPLDWMFPYLTPFGIIMKINRQPVPEITGDMMKKDHEFWSKYSERLTGNWITDETSVKEICDFAEAVYLRHDFTKFRGSRTFIRDDVAQKAFSKLRSAIAWIYGWRVSYECPPEYRPKTPAENQRLMKEAEFALKQSYAFCPKSPEALHKYVTLLINANRLDDALLIAETSLKFDPINPVFQSYVANLKSLGGHQTQLLQAQSQFAALEQQFRASPTNYALGLQLATAYIQMQQGESAVSILDQIMANPEVDASTLLQVAQAYAQLGKKPQLDLVVQKLKTMQGSMEQHFHADTNNVILAFQLISIYLITQQTNLAAELVDQLVARPQADPSTLLSAAQVYNQLQNPNKLEPVLQKLVASVPTNPEAWYDLAGVKAALGKTNDALSALQNAIRFSQQRIGVQSNGKDLRAEAVTDVRFSGLRQNPQFQQLIKPK